MAEAIRQVSMARGHDVRDHALVVFGQIAELDNERTLQTADHVRDVTLKHIHKENWLFLGRGVNYPIATPTLRILQVLY